MLLFLPMTNIIREAAARSASCCVLVNLGVLSWIVIEPHSPIAQALQAL